MSAVAGLRGTGDWGTDERPKDFRENILFFNPNGEAPIFALSAKAGKRVVKDPEFAWWCEGNALVRIQTAAGVTASTDTLINVASLDPTATTLGANYGTATHLKPGDILMVEPATSAAETQAYAPEIIEVDNVLGDTQFTAKRGVGGSTAASIGATFLADTDWVGIRGRHGRAPRGRAQPDQVLQLYADLQEHVRTDGDCGQDEGADRRRVVERQEAQSL